MKMQRLTERFSLRSEVEVFFPSLNAWLPGVVIKLEHPGIWVQTADGRPWFVTNGRRVRPRSTAEERGDEA